MNARDRQVAIETVRDRKDCHHCNPPDPTNEGTSMELKKHTRRRILETVEYDLPLPISLADLEEAIDQMKVGLTGVEADTFMIDHATAPKRLVFTYDREVPVVDSAEPARKRLSRQRDDDPVPINKEPERPVTEVALPEVPPLKNGDTVSLSSTVTYDGDGGAEVTDVRVVPPFPTTPEAGKDVELTQEIAWQLLDSPGTWYFQMEGKSLKEEDKARTRYRLRLNRAKNKHVHGDHILIETKKHRNPTALEVTIVR